MSYQTCSAKNIFRVWDETLKTFTFLPVTKGAEQFTTYVDSDGKNVYEGDLLLIKFTHEAASEPPFKGVVTFVHGTFQIVNDTVGEVYTLSSLFFDECVHTKVVGNIHDTKPSHSLKGEWKFGQEPTLVSDEEFDL